MTDTIEPTDAPPTARDAPDRLAGLEDRVRKLESAVIERPPAADEDAIAERVIAKLSAIGGEPRALPEGDRVVVLDSTARPVTPTAVPTAAPPPEAPLPPPPKGAVLHPPEPPADPSQKRWFLAQIGAEVRLMLQMYFDPHYRVSRTTQLAVPGIALLLVFNYFFFSVWVSIAFVSPVVERLLAVVLGVLGYKLIVRELARYRGVLEYLARYGR